MYRVALVGAGGIARQHARSWADIPDARLVGVADVFEEAARGLAAEYGAEAFGDCDAMLRATQADVVDICVPTPGHVHCVEQAAAAKPRAIIVEKPMARTVADCERMLATCKAAGVPLFVAHVLRFFPDFATARAQVASGAIGNVAAVRTRRGGPFPRGSQDWYADLEASGGVALDLMIHDLDWLRWTFGDVERVYAKGVAGMPASERPPKLDYGLATIRFRSGVIAHVEGTWADPGGFKVQFEIAGDRGLIDFNFNQPTAQPFGMALATADAGGANAKVPIPESPLAVDPYAAELAHFLECVTTGAAPIVTPEDGVEAVRLANAVLESMRSRRPVRMAEA